MGAGGVAAAALEVEIGQPLASLVVAAAEAVRQRPFLDRCGPAPAVLTGDEQALLVTEVASLIDRHYVFPAVGARIAEQLRGLPLDLDPVPVGDLAERLTRLLRTHDRHLKVVAAAGDDRPPLEGRPVDDAAAHGPDQPVPESGVTVTLDHGAAVVRVLSFVDADPDTAAGRAAGAALDRALAPIGDADSVLLDLRGCPGGAPSSVEILCDHVLPDAPVHLVSFSDRGGEVAQSWTAADPRIPRRPDVALVVDAATASAAESCAYVLQSLGRARVVGETTAGAANPGQLFPTLTGPAVFIPTGAPTDPRTGTNWEGTGVLPDIAAASATAPARARALLDAVG